MGSCIEERKKRAGKHERKKEENQQLNSVKPSSNLVKFRRYARTVLFDSVIIPVDSVIVTEN